MKPGVKRTKQEGRPKETFKKFKSEETKLGFMLNHETQLEYNLIMKFIPFSPFPKPPIKLIEIIAKVSKAPSFKKKKFFKYLEEYENYGLYCKQAKKFNSALKQYCKSLQDDKIKRYRLYCKPSNKTTMN